MNLKTILVAIGAAMLAAVGSAQAGSTFTKGFLKGTYQFSASGFFSDATGDDGTFTIGGLLSFNGLGGVNIAYEGMAVISYDNSGDVGGCFLTFDAAGSDYLVNSDGSGELTLDLASGNTCFNTGDSADINFLFYLHKNSATPIELVSTEFPTGSVTDPGDTTSPPITAAVLSGSMTKQ